MEAVIVAIITGTFGTIGVILNRRLIRTNSRDHNHVRNTLDGHTAEIGRLAGRIDGIRDDVAEVRDDVRQVRDAVLLALRDSPPVGVHGSDHFPNGHRPAATDPAALPDLPDRLGTALGGRLTDEPVPNGQSKPSYLPQHSERSVH